MNSLNFKIPSSFFFKQNIFSNAKSMFNSMISLTSNNNVIRNFVGLIEDMSVEENYLVETELFSKDVLEFYTQHNMNKLDKIKDKLLYDKYYTEMRGGGMGDYLLKFEDKLQNVKEALINFPKSRRAILTMPYSNKLSHEVKNFDDNEQKCLRELHFYIENDLLHCTGYMRCQAAIIFPKNIHFIGSIIKEVSQSIKLPAGCYTHIITTLVSDRQ